MSSKSLCSPQDDLASTEPLAFTNEQLNTMEKYAAERRSLAVPTILVVEDQEFSRKLLESMLRRHFVCNSATNAQEAIDLYGDQPPSITFLDIELPDMNGHELAALIKEHDPESFIVMVTANHYEKDVKLAVENKVDGFIAKPFSKGKILAVIEKFQQEHAKKVGN